jgi:DNA ligase-1
MKKFTAMLSEIDRTASTLRKTQLLSEYLSDEDEERNKLWMIALFTGKLPSRAISSTLLRAWAAEVADIPLWLFEQNYHIVGDLAETVALIVPKGAATNFKALYQWMEDIVSMKNEDIDTKKTFVFNAWNTLDKLSLWVFNKLITGGFRIGVSKNIIIQALCQSTGQDKDKIAYHLSGNWTPLNTTWQQLFNFDDIRAHPSKPYPFYLAYALTEGDETNIQPAEWTAEYKWDGIRCQLIKRNGEVFLWSRGEELITDKFPEFKSLTNAISDFVLDGEIVAWHVDKPMEFQKLQTRIGRKNPGKKILKEIPAKFIAYDIMEINHEDIRSIFFAERRVILQNLYHTLDNDVVWVSPVIQFSTIDELKDIRAKSKDQEAEGLMLKKNTGIYHTGRKTGDMWKWKVDPFTIDAVLIYAQRGHGRRSNLFSDFTFALWEDGKLIPFAKAYSGLTDLELKEVTSYVKSNTIETFGPVSSVKQELVFELAFEGISLSSRHKSGVAVRFPRIFRWRKDKVASQADTLENLKKFLITY